MNSKSKKQMAFLVILLGLLSFSIFSQITGGNHEPSPLEPVDRKPAKPQSSTASTATEVLQVHLLETKVPELSGVKRNIFQFEGKAAVSEERPPVLKIPQSQALIPTPPALPNVHYLGFYFEPDTGLKLASISNSGKVYVGKVGQILGGKYELLEIAADHIVLRLTEDGKVLRVPLGKGAPNVMDSAELEQEKEEE
jgi:hypothetical protein